MHAQGEGSEDDFVPSSKRGKAASGGRGRGAAGKGTRGRAGAPPVSGPDCAAGAIYGDIQQKKAWLRQ